MEIERSMEMRNRILKAKRRRALKRVVAICILILLLAVVAVAKSDKPNVVGYTYDTGNTIWEIAETHCPKGMDVREFVREIKEVNGIIDADKYDGRVCKIPVYEKESDYLDMNTVVGYETTDEGVLLLTSNGNGYFVEK